MLCRDLIASFQAAELRSAEPGMVGASRVRLVVDADEAFLKPDQAIPLALIANEALTNALNYAFPQGGDRPHPRHVPPQLPGHPAHDHQ